MMTPVVAQALLERGALDSAILGVSNLFHGISNIAQANPYVTIGVVVVLIYVLIRRR